MIKRRCLLTSLDLANFSMTSLSFLDKEKSWKLLQFVNYLNYLHYVHPFDLLSPLLIQPLRTLQRPGKRYCYLQECPWSLYQLLLDKPTYLLGKTKHMRFILVQLLVPLSLPLPLSTSQLLTKVNHYFVYTCSLGVKCDFWATTPTKYLFCHYSQLLTSLLAAPILH